MTCRAASYFTLVSLLSILLYVMMTFVVTMVLQCVTLSSSVSLFVSLLVCSQACISVQSVSLHANVKKFGKPPAGQPLSRTWAEPRYGAAWYACSHMQQTSQLVRSTALLTCGQSHTRCKATACCKSAESTASLKIATAHGRLACDMPQRQWSSSPHAAGPLLCPSSAAKPGAAPPCPQA